MRKRWAVGLAVVLIAGIGAVSLWPAKREPHYHGRKLSWWLTSSYDTHETAAAVRSIGTNAVPFLVSWIHCERPPWKDKAWAAYKKFPPALVNRSIASRLSFGTDERLADGSVAGFNILGPDAAAAVPDLIEMLKNSKAPLTARRAVICLGLIGPKARPALQYLKQLAVGSSPGISVDATMAIHNIESMDKESSRRF